MPFLAQEKKDIYCKHTLPEDVHLEPAGKEKIEIEIYGLKVTNRFACFALKFMVETVWLLLSIINSAFILFGSNLISTKQPVVHDHRCEHCKK